MLALQEDKVLTTPRLALEPLLSSHAIVLFDTLQNPDIYKYIPGQQPVSVSALHLRYKQLETRKSPTGKELWLNWAVKLKNTEQYIGTVQSTIHEDSSAYIAYVFGIDFWKQGFAIEACKQLIDFLISDYGIVKIKADVHIGNFASQSLLKNLGFIKTGENIEACDFYYERDIQ
ncbi:MAG: acetyltransferase family protein [Bacteroidota bacterium]|nr:acetyltransferase family protein [Bacteroidota bacterium]